MSVREFVEGSPAPDGGAIKVREQRESRPGDYAEVYADVTKIREERGNRAPDPRSRRAGHAWAWRKKHKNGYCRRRGREEGGRVRPEERQRRGKGALITEREFGARTAWEEDERGTPRDGRPPSDETNKRPSGARISKSGWRDESQASARAPPLHLLLVTLIKAPCGVRSLLTSRSPSPRDRSGSRALRSPLSRWTTPRSRRRSSSRCRAATSSPTRSRSRQRRGPESRRPAEILGRRLRLVAWRADFSKLALTPEAAAPPPRAADRGPGVRGGRLVGGSLAATRAEFKAKVDKAVGDVGFLQARAELGSGW